MKNYTSITLGELLSSENETIKRNAVSILKVLQKTEKKCFYCGEVNHNPNKLCNYHNYFKFPEKA